MHESNSNCCLIFFEYKCMSWYIQKSTVVNIQMYGYGYEYDTHKNSIYHRLRNICKCEFVCVYVWKIGPNRWVQFETALFCLSLASSNTLLCYIHPNKYMLFINKCWWWWWWRWWWRWDTSVTYVITGLVNTGEINLLFCCNLVQSLFLCGSGDVLCVHT